MSSRVRLPGESAEDCRRRTFQHTRQAWQHMVPADRARYAEQAKIHNHSIAVSLSEELVREIRVPTPSGDPEKQQQVAADAVDALVVTSSSTTSRGVDFVAPFRGTGAMGAGDKSFALGRGCIRRVQEEEAATCGTTTQFVNNLDTAWRTRSRGRVGEAAEFKHSTAMSCHEEFKCAMCGGKIKNVTLQDKLSEHLLTFVSEYRKKFVVNGRNKGPDCSVHHPLLVIKPQSFLVLSLVRVLSGVMGLVFPSPNSQDVLADSTL